MSEEFSLSPEELDECKVDLLVPSGILNIGVYKELMEMHGLEGKGRGKKRLYRVSPEALIDALEMIKGPIDPPIVYHDERDERYYKLWIMYEHYHLEWWPRCGLIYDAKRDGRVKDLAPLKPYFHALIKVLHNELLAMHYCPAPDLKKNNKERR